MDINVGVVEEELEHKESIVVKTEDEYEDISKLDVKTERDLSVEENQNGNLPVTFVKKEPDDHDIEKLKEEFSSSEEDDTLYEIKTEELMLKSYSERDENKTGVHSEDYKNETMDSFQKNAIKKHICHNCDVKPNEKNDLQCHIMLQHAKMMTTYSCCQCDYKTNRKRYLTNHMHKHDKNFRKYDCDHCEYKTHNKSYLKSHLLVQHDKNVIKKYGCDHCEYKTHFKSFLKSHLLKHDKNAIKKHGCDHCEYKSHTKSDLKRHVIVKHDKNIIKKYGCDHCKYRTHFKYDLKNHVLVKHDKNAIKKYSCNHCEYSSQYKSNLTRHVVKHEITQEVLL